MRSAADKSLTWMLVALLAVRAVLAFVPGTWGWSLQLQRFSPEVWVLWAIAAIALLPPVGRAGERATAGWGGAGEHAPLATTLLVALTAALAVLAGADRTWFTGDFLLRTGVLDSPVALARVAPQSLPLDLALHLEGPRWLVAAGVLANATDVARALGAVEAALFLGLALHAAGREGHRGSARTVFAFTLAGGAALSLMAGYGKTSGELMIATLAVVTASRGLAREGRGAALLGAALVLALLAHRSALLLLPVAVTAWVVAVRAGRRPRGVLAWSLGIVAPVAALAVVGPGILALLGGFDLPRHFAGGAAAGGPAALFSAAGLLDRANVALAFAPLAPAALVLAGRGPTIRAPGARAVTWSLALPAIAMAALVTPQQGLFRDWDVFVVPGTLLAFGVAGRLAAAVGDGRVSGRLAPPLVAAAVLGAGAWLVSAHDTPGGLARVRAFAMEEPRRDPVHVAKVWEFLGDRAAARGRWEEAGEALREAVVHQPSPRLFLMLSMAEAELGRLEAAQRAAAAAAARDSSSPSAWAAWASLALRRGDSTEARRAAEGLGRIAPGHALVRTVLGAAEGEAGAGP